MAMITPYDNVPLLVAEEGAVNFLSLYGGVLTLRILLSWFPQAQGVAFLQPIFTVSDKLPHPHLALTSPSPSSAPSPSPSPETLTVTHPQLSTLTLALALTLTLTNQVSDVYLNLFRGVIPAIAGLDISPIAAFFVLNLLTSSVASLG